MPKPVSRIHQNKRPIRRHYINEWLEVRDMEPADLIKGLNDPDRFSDLGFVDKSQVYRWLKGQMPGRDMQARLAAALEIRDPETGEPDPDGIMRHPDHDWLHRKFESLSEDEIKRLKNMVELAFPTRSGTKN
jgi:hypothetical protein